MRQNDRQLIAILLFASTSDFSNQAGLDACEVGSLLGDETALKLFVKQRYIVVSRITGGAKANRLGQLAQTEVVDFLIEVLDDDYNIKRNGYIELKGYDKKGGIPFDIVVERNDKAVGIEISFQVTTNSTIERKSGQSADRMKLMHESGHKLAYVLDGAGNFQRSSAISTICENTGEIQLLSRHMKTLVKKADIFIGIGVN